MALAASVVGWNEPAMHGAFLLPAVAAVLGTFFVARRLCNSPLLAAVLLLFTPVFLVSATGVMCDVWLLALWVWSIECWMRGLARNTFWLFLLSALLAAAAALTKYFGIALVPLLAAYTLARERGLTYRLLYLLIPIVILSSYEVISKANYGEGLFSNAMFFSWKQTAKPERDLLQQLLIGVSFTGGCLFSVIFYVPLLNSRRTLITGTAIFATLVPSLYFVMARTVASKSVLIPVAIEGALFLTIGIGILALALADFFQRKTADSLLLGLWVLGTFFFAAMMNWSITSRTILPMAPAVLILLIRRWQDAPRYNGARYWWPVVPAALVSLLIAAGDYKLANTARRASSYFQQRFHGELGTVWFEGHWGFQYYMQQWKAKALDISEHAIASGDVLIVPINNTNISPMPPLRAMAPAEQVNFLQFFTTTMNREIGAGFYSSIWGPLPWVVTRVPPEPYIIFRIK
jgi:4-amino-4-deoxy-L-arabinose transferase-like glycosyltransferase